jgi:hydrogenase expression/formation protein HypC
MCLAVPGKIVSIEDRDGTLMSVVDFGGIKKDVCLEYIPDAEVGQYVVVHVGFALQRLDEESAKRTLAEFEHLGVLKEEFTDGFELAAKQAGLGNPNPSPKLDVAAGAAPKTNVAAEAAPKTNVAAGAAPKTNGSSEAKS